MACTWQKKRTKKSPQKGGTCLVLHYQLYATKTQKKVCRRKELERLRSIKRQDKEKRTEFKMTADRRKEQGGERKANKKLWLLKMRRLI